MVRGVLTFAYRTMLYRSAYALEYDLRTTMYEHLTRMSFSFYDQVQSGQLISRANSDIRSVQLFLTFMPIVALNIASFVVALAIMLSVSVPLTVVAVAPLPFVYVFGVKMRELLFPISWIVQSRTADVATIVEENVTGARVVKSFAAEPQQLDALGLAARRLRWASILQVDVRARYAPLMEGLPRAGPGPGAARGRDGSPCRDRSRSARSWPSAPTWCSCRRRSARSASSCCSGSGRRLRRSHLRDPRHASPRCSTGRGRSTWSTRGARSTCGTSPSATARAARCCEHLDLHLDAGESVAIVGRTGSGKSTIARLLPRFYDVTDGTVLVDGHDVRDLTVRSLRGAIGLVLDEPFLFSASVRDNIAYGRPDASDDDVRAAARAAGAEDFIDALPDGFDTEVGERGYTLSGGQRQRVAIARTLLADPAILILDDATSAIDVQVEEEIHAALRVLMEGRTTLVIAHRTSTIALARRVVLLEGGRIEADGTHAGLMVTEPRYAEVLAHIEQVEASRRERAEAAREEAERRAALRDPDAPAPQAGPTLGGID